jgi:hypothetical protein
VFADDDSHLRMPFIHRSVTVGDSATPPPWFDGINSFTLTPSTKNGVVDGDDRLLASRLCVQRFADVIRLLSSLVAQADDVFAGLLAECHLLANRTNRLNCRLQSGLSERVQGLNAKTARRRTCQHSCSMIQLNVM